MSFASVSGVCPGDKVWNLRVFWWSEHLGHADDLIVGPLDGHLSMDAA